MANLIPQGFLTVRSAAERIASALYSGQPERAIIKQYRDDGGDVADGGAIDHAISEIWRAVDREKIHALVFNAARPEPLNLPASLSRGIPLLRSARGGNLAFLRHRNGSFGEFARRFGPDLSSVSILFRETEIERLARTLLQARRRKLAKAGTNTGGRPSRKNEVKPIIQEIVEQRTWLPTQSLKALTSLVNRRGKWLDEVSEDTVTRALSELHSETGDRRYERIRRAPERL